MEKRSVLLAAGAVAAAALLVVAAFVMIGDDDRNTDALPFETGPSDWNHWLGNLDMPGVSDAKTPTTGSDFSELWKVTAAMDGGSMNWKVPGSAICVGNYTYYYHGDEGKLKCVSTRTGELIREADCPSDAVYNMAIAYGDGKIFVPCKISGNVQVSVFDAQTLDRLFVTESVSGLEVQGSVVYHDGRIFFGTYSGDFVCFLTEDRDTSRSDEVVPVSWRIKASGWYNAAPAFAGRYCVVAEKGYAVGGMVIYVTDYKTGAIFDSHKIDGEYCTSGFILNHKDGRIYTAASKAPPGATEETSDKRLVVRSLKITSEGTIDKASFKTWESDVSNGGTQSTPVIYNDRLYIGGGGGTLGSDEPFHVLSIGADGTMTEAYRADAVKTKGTAAITNAYATVANGNQVYIYLMQYDTPGTVFVLRDKAGQDAPDIVFSFTPSVSQYSFQSFSVSPDGCLLIRNDSTLFCFGSAGTVSRATGLSAEGTSSGDHNSEDISNGIYRVLAFCEGGHVNPLELERLEGRFALLSKSDRNMVENYEDLQSVYRKVTLILDGRSIELKVPHGSLITLPSIEGGNGRIITGWSVTSDGTQEWLMWNDKVTNDLTVHAVYGDTIKMTFDSDGGSSIGEMYAVKGGKVGYLPDPVRNGYVFDGWYCEGVRIEQGGTAPADDIVLKAKWLRISTISFDSDGGSSASPIKATQSLPIGTMPQPAKDGHQFMGWFHEGMEYTKDTIWDLNADITLTAKWKQNEERTVEAGGIEVTSHLSDGASASLSALSDSSSTARKLREAAGNADVDVRLMTIAGEGMTADQDYVFRFAAGTWVSTIVYYLYGSNVYSAIGTDVSGVLVVVIKGNTSSAGAEIAFATVKAWTNTISFDSDGGSAELPIVVTFSDPIGDMPTPVRDGHMFAGWFYQGREYTKDTIWELDSDITLTAEWTVINQSRTIETGGIQITSNIPNNASATVTDLSDSSSSMRRMIELAGGININGRYITITGSDMWGGQEYVLRFAVNGSWADQECTLFYVCGSKAFSVSGGISGGILTVTVKGDKTSGGAQIAFAVPEGLLKIQVDSVTLDRSSAAVDLYYSTQLTATVHPSNAAEKGVTWESSDPAVAVVDANGKVVMVGIGTAVIIVTTDDGAKTAQCVVTARTSGDIVRIWDGDNNQISRINVETGSETPLRVSISSTIHTSEDIIWTSSDPAVASVIDGKVTATAVGTTVITARLNGTEYKAELTVTVTAGVNGMSVSVNDGNGWNTEITAGGNGCTALKGSGFFGDDSELAGLRDVSSAFNPEYGSILKLMGLRNDGDMKWHVFVYLDAGSGFSWVPGIDAIGLYRPFDDYHQEYATANLALYYGTAAEAAAELAALNTGNVLTTAELIEVVGIDEFRFEIKVAYGMEGDPPEGFEIDDVLGVPSKTFIGYGSDMYRALLDALGADVHGEFLPGLDFLGFGSDMLSDVLNIQGMSSVMCLGGDDASLMLDLPLGLYGPASAGIDEGGVSLDIMCVFLFLF